MSIFKPRDGWGPDRKRAAIALTFDNMGEAAWVEMGMWKEPIGKHYTADFVPTLIETLGDVRATYFMEASNAAIYPDAIKRWQAAGHEVGVHAWRHEAWDRTTAPQRQDILTRSLAAMRSIGVEPVGFRPPGGAVPPEAYAEFREAGLRYCSDLGEAGIRDEDGLIRLPFEWRNVDSYMIEDVAAPLRKIFGDPEAPATLADWRAELERTMAAALAEGGQRTIIFHPEFIGASQEKLAVVSWLVDRANKAGIWITRARDIAEFVADELESANVAA